MSDSRKKLKAIGRSASTESTDYSITMGKSFRKKKPKERWLLTRKTWRYMADAGRKLIPDGAQNRPEDIPKIEAYFQEVCKKEPKFLLWRKNSYPGAIGFRKKRKSHLKAGSCRKASSADEFEQDRLERPKNLAIYPTTSGKFDLRKMKEDFFNETPTEHSDYSMHDNINLSGSQENLQQETEERQLASMLETYLKIADDKDSVPSKLRHEFNYQELVDKLQRHLSTVSRQSSSLPGYYKPGQVHFQGDHVQKSLSETLSRYYGATGSRDKIVSDLLTNRKALEKLYFELRRTKGFRGSRGGTGYTSRYGVGPSQMPSYELKSTSSSRTDKRFSRPHPPPLIEIESETIEITYRDWGTQTLSVSELELQSCEKEYKKILAEREDEYGNKDTPNRRRSSVDNDDVSQSVSDTIKRYLRMARKKSVDTDKADRFKRVNYDRNLRNIKAKGEITKPGDDDGLNKGCQTNEDWILTYRDLKFQEITEISDVESRLSSARSSIDEGLKSTPTSPAPHKSSSHSFLSHLLHGKHDKSDKHSSPTAVTAAATMQKSKSSSSVIPGGLTKKIFRSRSKSQTRPAHTPCSWTPQGGCVWNSLGGQKVTLSDTSLLHLTEVERKVLQKVAIAKLQALNLGVTVRVPTENVGSVVNKPKRRPYLLKKKALTTGIFDTSRKDSDKDKDGSTSGGLVFGIPLTQCVENDRIARAAAGSSPFRSRGDISGEEPATIGRHGSRASFSSLIDSLKGDDRGSCDSLMSRPGMVGSVPGLLDKLSCGSTNDLPGINIEDEPAVPNIMNECIRHLEQHGLHTLGIFRVSTSKKRVRQLREDFDCGKETTMDEEQCPHDVATLLKEYLRDLPDPLLCRDLYHAFVQTQKIRNRKLQFEALQHLIQLLPPTHRDTLFSLLNFLATVAKYSNDGRHESGDPFEGNKMDSNNLATVFAPNILHCIKPGAKETTADRPEDRIDIINVVRILIDHFKQLFCISAELLDEVYVHMMDSYPEELNILLTKRDTSSVADDSVDDLDSESNSAPWTPTMPNAEMSIEKMIDAEGRNTPLEQKRTYSREEFLHEAAATGGPNVGMRIRHKDRIRERSERSLRKRREESSSRKRSSEESSGMSSAMSLISKLRGQKDDDYQFGKNRSSSIESSSSTHTDNDLQRVLRMSDDLNQRRKSSPYILDNSGVITASLTIPVQNQSLSYNVDDDIPYIEDVENGRQQLTIGLVRTPTAPPRRRQHSVSGSDSSLASNIQPVQGSISLMQGYDSAVGSSATYSSPVQNTPTSVASSIADQSMYSSPPSWTSSPPTSPDSNNTSVNYIPDDVQVQRPVRQRTTSGSKESSGPQKVSFSNTQEVQQTKFKDISRKFSGTDINKSVSAIELNPAKREPKFTPSISNIGNAVLRSKTQDFEKIIKVEAKAKAAAASSNAAAAEREKKKYTKRRYTDSRHQTRHIPDSEALESGANQTKKEGTSNLSQAPVYKRRELISSVPTK